MKKLREKLMEIPEDYYGESRSLDHKEEIIDLLESVGDRLFEALQQEGHI